MSLAELQQQALAALQAEDYSTAIDNFEQCIELEPTVRSSYWYLGLAHLLSREESDAQDAWFTIINRANLEEVAQLIQELKLFLIDKGRSLIRDSQYKLAETIFQQVLVLDLDKFEAYRHLSFIALQCQEPELAIEHGNRAIQLKPDSTNTLEILAAAFLMKKEWDTAVDCYQRLSKAQPDNIINYFFLGQALEERGNLIEACQYYQQAADLQPSSSQDQELVVSALNSLGHTLMVCLT
jgi:tetratricopeptide (TPR) repeat protein